MINQQRGATLIVVLFLLLAIVALGTLAVKQSLVGLNIATNSQAQQLLMQNADAAFFNVEREDNIIQALSSSGMFGYISGATDKDKEMVFCYRGEETGFFDISRASLIYWKPGQQAPTNSEFGADGYCDAAESETNFFTSGRKAVMTQVAVKFSSISENDPFFGAQFGTDDQTVKFDRSKPVKVFAVSVMPTLTSASATDINNCFKNHMSEATVPEGTTVALSADARRTVTECLSDLNVPYTSYVTEYVIVQDFV
ncbi:pilus assembly PilX family protein [Acinetobacter sp. CFCC 10889]|uniref:pilus assembly PilX family protein n=1 Tax=Acinetobacter sp. CFCC 10889 TaxID=1775557 RepID=UPI00148E2174|nr:pilus assembly protein PilX [Acinetobacter sp. CFCC 10889]